jgi:hypothetical protein
MHPDIVGDLAYAGLTETMFMPEALRDASWHAPVQFQQQMHAKDALERLAHSQILMAHARTAWLTRLATRQTDVNALAIILEACDRASSTFVKLMRATSEYHQPKSPSTNVSIGQANVAHQQIVQNVQRQEGRENAERTKMEGKGAFDAGVISAVAQGVDIPEGRNPEKSTVEKEHGPNNSRGESRGIDECAQARGAFHRRRRIPKAGEGHD